MSEVKRYVLRGPADCPAPDGSQIDRLLPGWQVVDAADYFALQAKVSELEERLTTLKQQRIKYGPICLVCGAAEPCHLKDDPHSPCTFDPAPRELWDKCQELKAKLRRIEQWVERESCGASLPSDPIEAIILIADERGKQVDRLNEKLRQVEEERDRARQGNDVLRDEMLRLAAKWEARLQQYAILEQERDQLRRDRQDMIWERDTLLTESGILRARVGRLEEALRHIAEARWSPRTTASYDEDARYAYPERESYVRQYARRALEGKEEHGTRHDE